jgi:hypothetical protein
MRWPGLLRRMVFIATPHHGAPLERGGNWVDLILGVSAYTASLARLGKICSAGITDLRYGNLVDEDWAGRDRFAGGGDRRMKSLVDVGGLTAQGQGCRSRPRGPLHYGKTMTCWR